MSEEINFQEQKINPDIWGTEEDWIDVANRPTPEVLPYAISNYCAQNSQAGLIKMEAKIPYLKQSNYNAGNVAGEQSRAMWRGLFLADEYGPEENELEDIDSVMPTEDFPAVWGLGANSPMANSYFILPGYISSGNLQTEVASVEYYYFGLNIDYSPSNYGTDVNEWSAAKTTPFCFTSQQLVNPYHAAQFSKRNFELPVNANYMTYNGQLGGNPILSFNYQNVVIYPVLYVAKENSNSAYGYDFAGPVSLEAYFDGVNWDPEEETGTPPLQQTYPYITSVCVGNWYMGPNDGTSRGSQDPNAFAGVAPGAFALHETQATEMLYKNQRKIWTTQCLSKVGDKNAYQSIQQSLLAGGIISGSKASGVTQYYTYTMQTNSRVDTDAKAFIAYTADTTSPTFPIFYQNGHYQPIIRQRTNPSNPNAPYTHYADFLSLWENATKEEVLKDVAYAGFWFSENATSAARSATGEDCDDPKMHIPVFDEYGITTGEYKSGVEAALEDNAKWQDPFKDNPYKPGDGPSPGPGPRPDPDPNPILPNSPAFTLAGRGTQCYAITPADMTEIFDDIYGRSSGSFDDLVDGLKLFGSDPMGAIISYKWYPFQYEPDPQAPIVLGTTEINAAHTYPIITNTTNSLKVFKASFWYGRDKNFVTSRNCQARLFLPFYGYYELPMPQVLSKELEVEFHYNCPDETGVWIISFGQVIYDYLECDCAIEIPLTGSNARNVRAAKVGAALSIAAQAAGTAATVAIGAATLSGGIGAARHLAEGIDVLAEEMGFGAGGLETGAYLGWSGLGTGRSAFNGMIGGMASSALGGVSGIANTIGQTIQTVNHLKVNVPFHPAADATTFLNLPMYPYIQFYTNQLIEGYNESEYRLKVGHACDTWDTLTNMPAASLCTATGIANMGTSGMEITEIQELNAILQSGFYKGTIPE